jgi:hypothetical protein
MISLVATAWKISGRRRRAKEESTQLETCRTAKPRRGEGKVTAGVERLVASTKNRLIMRVCGALHASAVGVLLGVVDLEL